MSDRLELQLYDLIGEAGFTRLVAGFYRRVAGDDILAPMYPAGDMEGAEWRLREFLIQRFGGPTRYSEARGHPRLRMRHVPFKIDQRARDRWVSLMAQSMAEADLPAQAHEILHPFFRDVGTFMINHPG